MAVEIEFGEVGEGGVRGESETLNLPLTLFLPDEDDMTGHESLCSHIKNIHTSS
jgi:hypothetical protein